MTTTVLVVEDETKLRDLLRSYFEREGMVVLSTPRVARPSTSRSGAGRTSSSLTSDSPTSPGRMSRRICGGSWMCRF